MQQFKAVTDILSNVLLVRQRYLKTVARQQEKHAPMLTRVRPAHIKLCRESARIESSHKCTQFTIVQKISDDHIRIRVCFEDSNDVLMQYAAHYYREKLSLHAFYNWKITKLFSLGIEALRPPVENHFLDKATCVDMTNIGTTVDDETYVQQIHSYTLPQHG